MKYNWKAVPEGTWLAFAGAFAGMAGALLVAFGAPEYLTVAVVAFVGSSFRLWISLIGASVSSEGTVSSGTEAVSNTPIPPSP